MNIFMSTKVAGNGSSVLVIDDSDKADAVQRALGQAGVTFIPVTAHPHGDATNRTYLIQVAQIVAVET